MRTGQPALTAAIPTAAEPLAVDDGNDGRHAGSGQLNDVAHDRAGEGGAVFARVARQLLDGVTAGFKPADDQRLVELGAAARAQGEDFAVRVARAGDAQGERALRAALAAARLQHDFMDDERRAVFPARAAEMRRVAAKRMKPFDIRAARPTFTVTRHIKHLRNMESAFAPVFDGLKHIQPQAGRAGSTVPYAPGGLGVKKPRPGRRKNCKPGQCAV